MAEFVNEDVAPTVQEVVDTLRPSAELRGIHISMEGECPPFPHHRTHLFNAVCNLVNNALPYVSAGGAVRLILSQADHFAEIAVADTGGGIPEEVKQGLFTDRVISTTMGEAGLGSRVAALVAESHGGSVLVESTPGIGTVIRLRFPIQRPIESPVNSEMVLQAVHRISTRLFLRPGLDELLPQILAAALESVGALAGTIWLHDPRDDTLVIHHVVGPDSDHLLGYRIPSNKGIAGAVFQSVQSIITGDAGQDPRHLEILKGFRTEPLVTIPLRNLGGRAIGVMQVMNKAGGGAFSADQDRVVLETLASLAATAIISAPQAEQARKAEMADAVGFIAHDIKGMMTPVEGWIATLQPVIAEAAVALQRLESAAPAAEARELSKLQELFKLMPKAMRAILERSTEVQDRGAEIADALRGKVREPCFVTERVDRTIGRVCNTVKALAGARGINITLEGACPPIPHDRTHIFHAVYNLVINAISFVPAGGRIRVVLSEAEGYAVISVEDNGKGMPDDVKESLFTESPITTRIGGSGLGTQIVARVAHAHHGAVSVESAPGKGTTIRLKLPLERPASPPAYPAPGFPAGTRNLPVHD